MTGRFVFNSWTPLFHFTALHYDGSSSRAQKDLFLVPFMLTLLFNHFMLPSSHHCMWPFADHLRDNATPDGLATERHVVGIRGGADSHRTHGRPHWRITHDAAQYSLLASPPFSLPPPVFEQFHDV